MKILVNKIDDSIVDLAYDIDITHNEDENSDGETIFQLKDEYGQIIPNKSYGGEYYIFDTGDDEVINKELMEAELPGLYCIEDGCIILKGAYSLNEIRKVKRDVSYIANTLELNQLEILYELSLLQLGLL